MLAASVVLRHFPIANDLSRLRSEYGRPRVCSLPAVRGYPTAMFRVFIAVAHALRSLLRLRFDLAIEKAALCLQLAVLKRGRGRPRLRSSDRLFWVLLRRVWSGWTGTLIIVKPETVIRWHRAGFRAYWRWKRTPLNRAKSSPRLQPRPRLSLCPALVVFTIDTSGATLHASLPDKTSDVDLPRLWLGPGHGSARSSGTCYWPADSSPTTELQHHLNLL